MKQAGRYAAMVIEYGCGVLITVGSDGAWRSKETYKFAQLNTGFARGSLHHGVIITDTSCKVPECTNLTYHTTDPLLRSMTI